MSSPTVNPSVIYNDAFAGIDWLTRVLGMNLRSRYAAPDGSVAFCGNGLAHRRRVRVQPAGRG